MLFYLVHEKEWPRIEAVLGEIMASERKVINLARELAGYPPVDEDEMKRAEEKVEAWMRENFPEEYEARPSVPETQRLTLEGVIQRFVWCG